MESSLTQHNNKQWLIDTCSNSSYWLTLAPFLKIECIGLKHPSEASSQPASSSSSSSSSSYCTQLELSSERITQLSNSLKEEGYCKINEPLLQNETLQYLKTAIEQMVALGWNPSFILLYDEIWQLMHHLNTTLTELTTGNRLHVDFAAFYVDGRKQSKTKQQELQQQPGRVPPQAPQHSEKKNEQQQKEQQEQRGRSREQIPQDQEAIPASGWPPHRDRSGSYEPSSFHGNGLPKYNTVWPFGANGVFSTISTFQNIRALPAKAGSLISFSHRLLHWGSKAAKHATHPRIAISFCYAMPEYEAPFLEESYLPLPPFSLRLGLVAGQLFTYATQTGMTVDRADALMELFVANSTGLTQVYIQRVTRTEAFQKAYIRRSVRQQALERSKRLAAAVDSEEDDEEEEGALKAFSLM